MAVPNVIEFWDHVRAGLIETIGRFQQSDLDFAPFEGGYSVRQIILHIAQEENGEVQYGITHSLSEFPPTYIDADFPNVASLRDLLDLVHAQTFNYLEGVSGLELHQDIEAG